jgi:hypothetical protein
MSDPQEQHVQAPQQQFQAPPAPPQPKPEVPAERPTKMRPVAIGLFVLGIIVVLGGIANFGPGGAATGGAMAFLGIVVFALSFIPLPQVDGAEPPMAPLEKVTGIFYEPTRVFRNLRAHPRWLIAFVIICVMSVAYTAAFTQRLTPERIVNFMTDKLAESGFVPADRIEEARARQLEQAKNPVQRVGTAVKSVVGIFCVFGVLAGLFLLGVLAFGGRINFWQAFAALMYASLPVTIIQKAISLVILYVKSPDDIHPVLGAETLVQDNLGILFAPSVHPVLFVTGTAIGILSLYRLWLTAKGLQYAGYKVSSTAAWGVTITVFILSLILAMIFAALFSSFIS